MGVLAGCMQYRCYDGADGHSLWTPDRALPSYVFTVSRPLYDDNRLCAWQVEPVIDSHLCASGHRFEVSLGILRHAVLMSFSTTDTTLEGVLRLSHWRGVAAPPAHRIEQQLRNLEPVWTELQLLPIWKLHSAKHSSLEKSTRGAYCRRRLRADECSPDGLRDTLTFSGSCHCLVVRPSASGWSQAAIPPSRRGP